MSIWVDADACPVVIKEILFRAADRAKLHVTFVANQTLNIPKSPFVDFIQVPKGFDIADNEIVQRVESGDLVITADIPLAAEVIDKGGIALNPRGELYTKANIKARLTMRDFMDNLRSSGIDTGGSAPMSQTERREFANQLDKYLSKA